MQVDFSVVQMDVIKPWIAKRVTELLGLEDEVVIDMIYNLLSEKVHRPKRLSNSPIYWFPSASDKSAAARLISSLVWLWGLAEREWEEGANRDHGIFGEECREVHERAVDPSLECSKKPVRDSSAIPGRRGR